MTIQLNIAKDQISSFCRKWQVKRLSLFGSVTQEDFRPDSAECIYEQG